MKLIPPSFSPGMELKAAALQIACSVNWDFDNGCSHMHKHAPTSCFRQGTNNINKYMKETDGGIQRDRWIDLERLTGLPM